MKKIFEKNVTEEELRSFLFGWLWVEENLMEPIREKLNELNKKGK